MALLIITGQPTNLRGTLTKGKSFHSIATEGNFCWEFLTTHHTRFFSIALGSVIKYR